MRLNFEFYPSLAVDSQTVTELHFDAINHWIAFQCDQTPIGSHFNAIRPRATINAKHLKQLAQQDVDDLT